MNRNNNISHLDMSILIVNDYDYKETMPYYTIKKDDLELRIYYRAIGSKSEGPHGVLLYKNKHIKGKNVNDMVNTPIGTLKYYGEYPSEVNYPWYPSGWNYANRDNILASWEVKNKVSFIKK